MNQPAPSSILHIETLKKRAEFLAMNREAKKFITGNFILLMRPSPKKPGEKPGEKPEKTTPTIRVGYTVTKKIGNAVVRNRTKRRLREAVRHGAPHHALADHDYVIIARQKAHACVFSELQRDLEFAFSRIPYMKKQEQPFTPKRRNRS